MDAPTGPDIFLWQNKELPVGPQCQLKYFLNFVKFLDLKRWTDFAYVPEESDLLPNLTLKENLFLEAIPPSLSLSKEFQLREFLQKTGNEYLLQIFKMISHPDYYPSQVDLHEKKLICLLRALLKESEFLFLEEPSLHLKENAEEISLIKLALSHESKKRNRVVIISMKKWEVWADLITKVITRVPQGRYLIQASPKVPPQAQDVALDQSTAQNSPDRFHNLKWGR